MTQEIFKKFSDFTKEAKDKATEAKILATEAKNRQERLDKTIKSYLNNRTLPSDEMIEEYVSSVIDMREKAKTFSEASDFFHKCVKNLEKLHQNFVVSNKRQKL